MQLLLWQSWCAASQQRQWHSLAGLGCQLCCKLGVQLSKCVAEALLHGRAVHCATQHTGTQQRSMPHNLHAGWQALPPLRRPRTQAASHRVAGRVVHAGHGSSRRASQAKPTAIHLHKCNMQAAADALCGAVPALPVAHCPCPMCKGHTLRGCPHHT